MVNRVTAGDYDCPRKVLMFLTDLHAAFRMLNLRNDFLRKKFDGKPITLVYLMQSEVPKDFLLVYCSSTCYFNYKLVYLLTCIKLGFCVFPH